MNHNGFRHFYHLVPMFTWVERDGDCDCAMSASYTIRLRFFNDFSILIEWLLFDFDTIICIVLVDFN